ncbi:hypothetical protein SISNIDRAFT_504138 [Sistotremastrum niveocremeum HHB9708]|nr:hypothetical protein SISNIDRAFT_504138 [Sistotremastrum niveocremeum HHB9708]
MSSKLVDAWRVQLNLNDRDRLLTTYMDLVAEASDPKLLERAVASFSFVEWFWTQEQSQEELAQLKKTWDRLTATDTSLRVRETLTARARKFVPSDSQNLRELGEGLTTELVQFFLGTHSFPLYFHDSLVEDAFKPDNADLRPLAALPFEECIARVLFSYNHKGKLGDRRNIFDLAEYHCYDLLEKGKIDDVTRILSHLDRLQLIKSSIQHPHAIIYPSLVEFIVKDRKHEILRGINEFVKEVDQSRLVPLSLSEVFCILASPPPTDINLSPLIDYFSRHPKYWTWEETSDTIIAYLDSFDLSQISDSTAVRRFLEQCANTEVPNGYRYGDWYPTSNESRARARDLLAGESSSLSLPLHSTNRARKLNSLSSPPAVAIASTSTHPASPSHSPTHTPPLNDASRPDPLLPHSADSPAAPAQESVEVDAVPSADPHYDNRMTALDHSRPILPSSESTSDPSLDSDSRVVFDQSPALENAHQED